MRLSMTRRRRCCRRDNPQSWLAEAISRCIRTGILSCQLSLFCSYYKLYPLPEISTSKRNFYNFHYRVIFPLYFYFSSIFSTFSHFSPPFFIFVHFLFPPHSLFFLRDWDSKTQLAKDERTLYLQAYSQLGPREQTIVAIHPHQQMTSEEFLSCLIQLCEQ